MQLYDIWLVTYMTYAEEAERGEKKPQLVERGLTYERGLQRVAELGFGYCIKPD